MTTRNRPVATVERAVAVLRALSDSPVDLGNNEISRRTDINASTVSRLLATLAQNDMVRRVPDSGRFRLGPRCVELGNAAIGRDDLRQLAHPHLVALTAATGETSTLSVPDDSSTITVDFVQSPASVRSVAQVGRPAVTHATATGKIFLAHGGSLPAGALPAFTPRTITDGAVLAAEVARARKRGWAQAVGERELDLNAIAAPVLGRGGCLLAVLGLQGPAARFGPRAMRTAADLLVTRSAALASAELASDDLR